LQSVALAETVGYVKTRFAAEHFDGGFEQDYGGGAVYVVVAVEEDWLMTRYRSLQSLDGCGHAEHEKWIVEVSKLRIEEGVGLGCGGDAAGEEQLREGLGQVGCLGESRGLFKVRLGDEPTLEGALASGWIRLSGWVQNWEGLLTRGACRSCWTRHGAYSSSWSPWASSMTMSWKLSISSSSAW
jgi:hypothetical protein